jgi:Arm DNA-binding domain
LNAFLVATTVATNAVKLTKRTVDALAPRDKPFIIFDADVKGFCLRIMPTGNKTFSKRRLTLGRYGGAMTVDQARKAAQTASATVRLGSDPQAEKNHQRGAVSVADLIDAFLADYVAKLKAKSQSAYAESLAKLRTAYR